MVISGGLYLSGRFGQDGEISQTLGQLEIGGSHLLLLVWVGLVTVDNKDRFAHHGDSIKFDLILESIQRGSRKLVLLVALTAHI